MFHSDLVESQAGWLLAERPFAATGIILMSVALTWYLVPKAYHATKAKLASGKNKPAMAKAKS